MNRIKNRLLRESSFASAGAAIDTSDALARRIFRGGLRVSPRLGLAHRFLGPGPPHLLVEFGDGLVPDLTGDARDEIVLWDQERVWIYTQDRPFSGERIYAPQRNPDYNESNYRTVVSRPGWTGSGPRVPHRGTR